MWKETGSCEWPSECDESRLTDNRKLKAVDFLGIFLALAGMTVVILGLTWGGKDYAWNSTQVITTLVVGIAVSVAFIMWQWQGPKYPLIPCKNIRSHCGLFSDRYQCTYSSRRSSTAHV